MRVIAVVLSIVVLLAGCLPVGAARVKSNVAATGFFAQTGVYTVHFVKSHGVITVARPGTRARLEIRELAGSSKINLLYSVNSVRRTAATYVLSGRSAWASFQLTVALRTSIPGLIRLSLTVIRLKSAPTSTRFTGDVQLRGAPATDLTQFGSGPPIAGSSVLLSSRSLRSTILYLEDFTSLGSFFDRSQTGVSQGTFDYPRAGGKGSLVGAVGNGSFGYPVSAGSINGLQRGKSTRVLDTYIYMRPTAAKGEQSSVDAYLQSLGTIFQILPKPSIPTADWGSLAAKVAGNLADPANLVTIRGKQYLRSYVSDSRTAPEFITQVGVLAGIQAYEARYHTTVPLAATLESGLTDFYDPQFHTIMNGLGHDPAARGESWYFVTNMISLLQLATLGSPVAKSLLFQSSDAVMALAHVNGYEFPQDFRYSDFNGKGTGLQPDVAGGYAWLMLGLFDLTHDQRYVDEAKVSLSHVSGKGFSLAYETHMSAYAAAAAQRLYTMTGDQRFHDEALLSLANVFHATRLWDCTYGHCRTGSGYHTYFGLNPLPWSDYTAMLEQYEAWLALLDYVRYSEKEPAWITGLVRGFVHYTPLSMQYTLPPLLPAGTASKAAGEYAFVPRNNLAWYIPLEDLREGEQTSGIIGQEIYGAGGPFFFAAYGQ
ncbi:MAG: hypothetical protein NVS2B16_19910 [Chloroflexota bacterium]